ncbi:MAG: hypothetical protein LBB36_06320, partial [Fibromonadaceae bacterium]|nr:hypothetical protein [Fibromonadaceae bacterium]
CRYTNNPNDFGNEDVITINGLVKVNVNVYPFSVNGRRFGNGVYILKVDKVDLPYKGCMNAGGTAVLDSIPFIRHHADVKMGWMRVKSSK